MFLRIQDASEPTSISISPADVARGYVDIPISHQLQVLTNNRAGFNLVVSANLENIKAVELIVTSGTAIRIDRLASSTTLRYAGTMEPVEIELHYRVILDPMTEPGNYPWPLVVAAAPAI